MAIGIHRFKDRGPTSSREYNERIREMSETFLDILGRVTSAEADVRALSSLTAIEHAATSFTFESLSAQLEQYQQKAQDATQNVKYCTVFDQIAVIETDINDVPIADKLSWEGDVGIAVLPYTTKISKLGFTDPNGGWTIDPGVKVAYRCTYTEGESVVDAVHEANEIVRALDHNQATAFLVRSPEGTGTSRVLTVYVAVPAESASGALVNYIELDPSPRSSLNLLRVCYSTKPGAALDEESDPLQWKDLWVPEAEESQLTLLNKRYRAPQDGDASTIQQACGPRRYYMGERRVTAIKVVLEATETFQVEEGLEYFVGLRHLDVGHVSFGSTGRLVFEYEMPLGVKRINEVIPRLANPGTPDDGIDGVGTALPELTLFYKDNNVWSAYTPGTLVGNIDAVRIEAAMSMPSNGCTPVLIGFDVKYARS